MLSTAIKRQLKQQAHHLHPVVIVGQHGVTPAVITETDKALQAHELIKVKIHHPERLARKNMADNLSTATHADVVQSIGSMILLYRPNPAEPTTTLRPKSTQKPTSRTRTRTRTRHKFAKRK